MEFSWESQNLAKNLFTHCGNALNAEILGLKGKNENVGTFSYDCGNV